MKDPQFRHNSMMLAEHTEAINLAAEDACQQMSGLSSYLRKHPPRSLERRHCLETLTYIGRLFSYLHQMEKAVGALGLAPDSDAPKATAGVDGCDTSSPDEELAEAVKLLGYLQDDASQALAELQALRDYKGDLREAFNNVRPRFIDIDEIGFPVLSEEFMWRLATCKIATDFWAERDPECARLDAEIAHTFEQVRKLFGELEPRVLAERGRRGAQPDSHG